MTSGGSQGVAGCLQRLSPLSSGTLIYTVVACILPLPLLLLLPLLLAGVCPSCSSSSPCNSSRSSAPTSSACSILPAAAPCRRPLLLLLLRPRWWPPSPL